MPVYRVRKGSRLHAGAGAAVTISRGVLRHDEPGRAVFVHELRAFADELKRLP